MKGTSMNFMIGLFIALMMFLIIGTITIESITGASNAVEGCSPLASIIADASAGAVEPC